MIFTNSSSNFSLSCDFVSSGEEDGERERSGSAFSASSSRGAVAGSASSETASFDALGARGRGEGRRRRAAGWAGCVRQRSPSAPGSRRHTPLKLWTRSAFLPAVPRFCRSRAHTMSVAVGNRFQGRRLPSGTVPRPAFSGRHLCGTRGNSEGERGPGGRLTSPLPLCLPQEGRRSACSKLGRRSGWRRSTG